MLIQAMAEKAIYRALFSAARVTARTLILQPARIKTDLARKAVSAAAMELGKAAGRAASALLFTSASPKAAAYKSVLASKAPQAKAAGRSWASGGSSPRREGGPR